MKSNRFDVSGLFNAPEYFPARGFQDHDSNFHPATISWDSINAFNLLREISGKDAFLALKNKHKLFCSIFHVCQAQLIKSAIPIGLPDQ